jgi:hypothetical protein
VYRIRPSRGFDVPSEVLGADYHGALGCDGWIVYQSFDGTWPLLRTKMSMMARS